MTRINVLLVLLLGPLGCYAGCFSAPMSPSYFVNDRLVSPSDFRAERLIKVSKEILAGHPNEFVDVSFFRSESERSAFAFVAGVGFAGYDVWRRVYDQFRDTYNNLQDHSWAMAELFSVGSCSILLVRDGPTVSRYVLTGSNPLVLTIRNGAAFEILQFAVLGGSPLPKSGSRLEVFLKPLSALTTDGGMEAWRLLALALPFKELATEARADGWFAEQTSFFFDPFRDDLSPPSKEAYARGKTVTCYNTLTEGPYCYKGRPGG